MRYLVAGFIAGYAMSLAFMMVASWSLVRHRAAVAEVMGRLASGTSIARLAGLFALLPFLGWGTLGLLLGILYSGIERAAPGRGLASPNLPYTLLVLLIIAGFLWVLVPFRRLWPEIASLFVAFAAIFGWLLPWLAA